MQEIDPNIFRKTSQKLWQLPLILFSIPMFILIQSLTIGFFQQRLTEFDSLDIWLQEFLLTHKFLIFMSFQGSVFFLIYISLRPAIAINQIGIYIRPGILHASTCYFLAWQKLSWLKKTLTKMTREQFSEI